MKSVLDTTKQSMTQYRMTNPKPQLFDLIHKWNLAQDQVASLRYYKYKELCAVNLTSELNTNRGKIKQFISSLELKLTFVPIYMNCTRTRINNYEYGDRYHLSFRSTNDGQNIVLIQPVE